MNFKIFINDIVNENSNFESHRKTSDRMLLLEKWLIR